jgi:hypothetical protein
MVKRCSSRLSRRERVGRFERNERRRGIDRTERWRRQPRRVGAQADQQEPSGREEFRQRLLDDPKGTLEQELGDRLPEGVEVWAVQESAQTIYLVLPSASSLGEGGEISDEELDAVAGGTSVSSPTCGNTCFGNTCGLNCAVP